MTNPRRNPPRLPAFQAKAFVPKPPNPLSPREKIAVLGICHGLTNKEIAVEMESTEQCVKNFLKYAYVKLREPNRSAAIIHAIQQGWFIP